MVTGRFGEGFGWKCYRGEEEVEEVRIQGLEDEKRRGREVPRINWKGGIGLSIVTRFLRI